MNQSRTDHAEISANAENKAFSPRQRRPLFNGLQTVSPLQLFNTTAGTEKNNDQGPRGKTYGQVFREQE